MCKKAPEEPAAQEPLYVLLPQLAHRYFSCCFVRLEKLGVHPGQVPLLLALNGHGGCTQAELSRRLHIKSPTVTVMLDKMERSGLVERRQDARDKRKLRIFLTPSGTDVTERAQAVVREISAALIAGIDGGELAVFCSVLERMRQNMDAACASPPGMYGGPQASP